MHNNFKRDVTVSIRCVRRWRERRVRKWVGLVRSMVASLALLEAIQSYVVLAHIGNVFVTNCHGPWPHILSIRCTHPSECMQGFCTDLKLDKHLTPTHFMVLLCRFFFARKHGLKGMRVRMENRGTSNSGRAE